jgi:putative hemolysin
MSLTVWLVVVLLILANGFYVTAEFGAVGVRRSRVRRLSEDGSPWARLLLPFVQDPAALARYVAASQVGITLSSLVLGAVAQGTVAMALAPPLVNWVGLEPAVAESTAAVVVLVALTAVQVLIAELIPKSIALRFPTEVALATVLPMRWSLVAFRPLISLVNGSATAVLRLFGISAGSHRHLHSPDELALMIAESRDGGLLEPDEQQRLHRALHLGKRTAGDLMVPRDRLTMVPETATWDEILPIVSASPFSRLPVYRERRDRVVGTLRVKDLVHRYLAEGPPVTAGSLARPVATIPVTLPADQVLTAMKAKRAHQAVVLDGTGAVIGLITIQDVLGALLGSEGAAS